MPEETVHESTRSRSRTAIAGYLRRLANGFDGGGAVPVDDSVTVDPPEESEVEVEVEREGDELSLEVDVSWPEDEGDVETDADFEEPDSKATFELYQDRADEWRWRLRHVNGNIIADSGEGYTNKADAKNGIESVKGNADGAVVEEQE